VRHRRRGSPLSRENMRAFRIPDDEWQEALAVARSRDEKLSAVIREALRKYVMRHTPKP